ncbi:MAG: alpha/beta hydrolase [Lachnospiraceae bacterium]|nr:alpha/beta hydrolase [Lachnospiraceae bacterium]
MFVHEFIEGNKPIMVLVHGVLTPWQVWTPQITAFKEKYNIYVVALNAHTEERASEFVSVQSEAEEIVRYFEEKSIDTLDVLCGISLGGKIAHEIWKRGSLNIHNLVMDGAPLVACPGFAIRIMINNYKDIIHKSKVRDEKVIENFKRYFLPEKYLDSFLKIADFMTDTSIENIVNSVFAGGKIEGVENRSRILFIHGTKGNEILSKKAAKLMKKYYPTTETVCFKGDAHCYKVIYEPEEWIEVVEKFLRANQF